MTQVTLFAEMFLFINRLSLNILFFEFLEWLLNIDHANCVKIKIVHLIFRFPVSVMGQANSSRERHKSGDIQPCSPGKDGQAFVFDKKPNKLLYQTSGDDDDYLNAKVSTKFNKFCKK